MPSNIEPNHGHTLPSLDSVNAPIQDIALPALDQGYANEGFPSRLADTLNTLFKQELSEEGHRFRRVGALALGAATQALDRGRAMIFALPLAFDESMEFAIEHGLNGYQSALASAVAVGGVFGTWGQIVGKSFQASMNAFPETTERVVENHPAMVSVISKAIDGFPSRTELDENHPFTLGAGFEVGPYDTRKTKIGKALLAITRGAKTAFLYGTTAHVGVAKVSNHTDESIKKRLNATSLEAAGVLGFVAAGMSTMFTHDLFGAAEQVRDAITSKANLGAASLFFIGLAAGSNYLSRKNEIKKMHETASKAQNVKRSLRSRLVRKNKNATNIEAFLSGYDNTLSSSVEEEA